MYVAQSYVGQLMIEQLGIGSDWTQFPLSNQDQLAWYVDAIGALFQETAGLALDVGEDGQPGYVPGYGALLDVNLCPTADLPFLGQFVGVQVPPNATDAEARSMISAEQGFHRGTPAAIIAAAQRFLSGTQTVTLIERQNGNSQASAYDFVLVVLASQIGSGYNWNTVPTTWATAQGTWSSADQTAALIAAVDAVKPGGLMWTLVKSSGHPWSAASGTWAAAAQTWAQSA